VGAYHGGLALPSILQRGCFPWWGAYTAGVSDRNFAGSIPDLYDRFLGPLLFRPYAVDMAARLADVSAAQLLEVAAGTGIATAEVARAMPDGTSIVATDLNQAMLDTAALRVDTPGVQFRTADAQALPFPDANFDAVFCQFGVMFVPDTAKAYSEMRRVLRHDGTLLFNVWDRIETSPIVATVADALAAHFPEDPPRFLSRVPYGYHDPGTIRDDLSAAGYHKITVDTVALPAVAPSAWEAAVGFCQGTPLRHEITARDPAGLPAATHAARDALAARFGEGTVRAEMSALVITARCGGSPRARSSSAEPGTRHGPH
jgi:SAM-dependent methyltransferase